jgi:FkbM family methyltransferase
MIRILTYILKNNSWLKVPKYLFFGLSYQIFKRISGNIISKKIFNGKRIILFPNCNVSTMYAYTDIPDKDEILLLRKLVDNSEMTTFIDVGANIGNYSVSMMDLCDDIIAFEPHPFTNQRCRMNFLLNNIDEDRVKALALSDEIGTVYFSDVGGSSTVNHIIDNKEGIEVACTTLDAFLLDNNFSTNREYILKVDIEGFEYNFFMGALDFLKNYNLRGIIFECFEDERVFQILRDNGYKLEKISENNYYAIR